MENKANWLEENIMFPLAGPDHAVYLVAATQAQGSRQRMWGGWVAPQAWPCKSKPAEGGLVSVCVNQVCGNHWSKAGRTKPTKRRTGKEGTATSLDWQKTSESGNPWVLCHPASGHSSGNLTSPVSKYILYSELGLWNSSLLERRTNVDIMPLCMRSPGRSSQPARWFLDYWEHCGSVSLSPLSPK